MNKIEELIYIKDVYNQNINAYKRLISIEKRPFTDDERKTILIQLIYKLAALSCLKFTYQIPEFKPKFESRQLNDVKMRIKSYNEKVSGLKEIQKKIL